MSVKAKNTTRKKTAAGTQVTSRLTGDATKAVGGNVAYATAGQRLGPHRAAAGRSSAMFRVSGSVQMPGKKAPISRIDDKKKRGDLALLITRLFDRWKLSTADQLELLGLSPSSRSLPTKYRKGEPVPTSRDVQDRIGLLLSIHQSLRMLYPENPDFYYDWVHLRNRHLDNLTPLDVMREQGMIGIVRIVQYLNYLKGI